MKTIITMAAAFAFVTSAFAAAPSAPAENKAVLKMEQRIELALGQSRSGGITTKGKNTPANGKTYTG